MAQEGEDRDQEKDKLARKAGESVRKEAIKAVKSGFTRDAQAVCKRVLSVTVENAIREKWTEAEKKQKGTVKKEATKYWRLHRDYFKQHGRCITVVAKALTITQGYKKIDTDQVCNAATMVINWARTKCDEWSKSQPDEIVPYFGCRGFKGPSSIECTPSRS